VRGELVVRAVPRDERDAPTVDLADDRRGGGGAVGGIDLVDGLGRLQERVEARAPEDPDLGGRHALFSFFGFAGAAEDEASEEEDPLPGSEPDEPDDDEPDDEELEVAESPLDGVDVLAFERLSVA
jgi:hypothetical protein